MSYTTITQCTNDVAFQNRIEAAVSKEAWNNPALSETPFGAQARQNPSPGMFALLWPCSIDAEAAYEYALLAENPNPGGDPTVITDAQILSSVQAHWLTEEAGPPPP